MGKETYNRRQPALSIRLSTDGFCFCSQSAKTSQKEIWGFHPNDISLPYTVNLARFLSDDTFSNIPENGRIKIELANTLYTAVPTDVFHAEEARLLYPYRSAQSTSEDDFVLHNLIPGFSVALLFSIAKQERQLLDKKFPNAEYFSPITLLLHGISRKAEDKRPLMVVYVHEQQADLLCFSLGKPVFINRFPFENKENLTYYILSVWEMLGFSQKDDLLLLSCPQEKISTLHDALSPFVPHTERDCAPYFDGLYPAEKIQSTAPLDMRLLLCE